MNIQDNQRRKIYALLRNAGLNEGDKKELVMSFTRQRTEHSSEMSFREADELIKWLESRFSQLDRADRMRKKIISMAREMGWECSPASLKGAKPLADMQRINQWCTRFGYLHKPLNDYKYKELPALVTQFEQVYRSFLKAI